MRLDSKNLGKNGGNQKETTNQNNWYAQQDSTLKPEDFKTKSIAWKACLEEDFTYPSTTQTILP